MLNQQNNLVDQILVNNPAPSENKTRNHAINTAITKPEKGIVVFYTLDVFELLIFKFYEGLTVLKNQ